MTPVKEAAEETAMSDIGDEYMDEEWIDMHDEVFSKPKNNK